MTAIQNKSILVLEDNGLIGEIIAETIQDAGGKPIGPVMTSAEALDMININPSAHDGAVLDLRANGTSVHIAQRLCDLGIPFIFATGCKQDIPVSLRHAPVCEKPYTARELISALERAFSQHGIN